MIVREQTGMTANELATAVGTEAANELASALARIKHCLSGSCRAARTRP